MGWRSQEWGRGLRLCSGVEGGAGGGWWLQWDAENKFQKFLRGEQSEILSYQ